MGVNGLWNVIQPCARPTNLATLNQKRLAVDASIWIYQFLKAVRDKEGNALRNSHVVGFFRRICKLLWFGIKPVFVFDGGAPALKRQTISGRKQRREGRRDDAVRTAGKLLAVQMQRIAEEEEENRRKRREMEADNDPPEEIPEADKLVYVDEIGMSQNERQKSRRFYKQDAYHLPELGGSIESMGRPEDPRIMSIDQLEEYARQFHSGEDINLYDFSKIDFEGEFFKSLPPADRYNILNAARMRSRLRMGLSKEQLDGMFPDRMAFSRFQIERVQERNHLTQRLMKEAGMTGTDLTLGVNGRVAGEGDREYILVKNEGAEGGWALGVVSKDKDRGEIHKPIDVDALDFQFQTKDNEHDVDDDDDDFEDVPIEGLNRLPRTTAAEQAQQSNPSDHVAPNDDDDTLFVAQEPSNDMDALFEPPTHDHELSHDEEEDVDRAIALSLRNQHGAGAETQDDEDLDFEDVPAPEWTQRAVDQPKPMTSGSGSMIAHMVNNRASAAVPKRRPSNASSDSDDDLRAALSKAKTKTAPRPKPQTGPAVPNIKNPFDGPLPFEKLDWKSSIFAKKPEASSSKPVEKDASAQGLEGDGGLDDMAGGFEREAEDEDDAPKPLPPWMVPDESDIRDAVKARQKHENEINEADREAALEEEKRIRREAVIEIESSDDESDVEVIDAPAVPAETPELRTGAPRLSPASMAAVYSPKASPSDLANEVEEADLSQDMVVPPDIDARTHEKTPEPNEIAPSSPEPEFEEVEEFQPLGEEVQQIQVEESAVNDAIAETMQNEPVHPQETEMPVIDEKEIIFGDGADDDFSDPEEDELLAQMAAEAEEHARFASQLNNKSEKENQEAYERELKALRNQQKKDRRDADEVTQIMITECQALLRFFGIPYITAPMEAEAQCAELVSLGLVDGIVTDDSDIFLFGGTRVYKNMFNSNKFVELYLETDLEKELSLSREQLISLAHLLGSDYTEGLPGVGPVTAVEVISEFPGREGLAGFREWWQDVQNHGRPKEADQASSFRRKFRKSQGKKLFLPPGFPNPAVFDAYLKPEVDNEAEPFQWGVPDVEGLRQFLMATIGWSQERTDEVLVPVIRDMNRRDREGTQSNITRFFGGSVGVGAKEAFAPRQRVGNSKRMTQAVNKLRANAVVDNLSSTSDTGDAATSGTKRKRRATAASQPQGNETEGGGEGDVNGQNMDVDEDGAFVDTITEKPRGRGAKGKGKRAKAPF